MSNLVVLPGVARPDLQQPCPIRDVLASVANAGLQDVAVVGRDLAGEIVVWGSATDADKTVGLLYRGAAWIATAKQVDE
jgi:hypothetical protein